MWLFGCENCLQFISTSQFVFACRRNKSTCQNLNMKYCVDINLKKKEKIKWKNENKMQKENSK